MFNGLLKIPMQFFILFIGVMVFVSFQFNKPPVTFNEHKIEMTEAQANELSGIERQYDEVFELKKDLLLEDSQQNQAMVIDLQQDQDSLRTKYKAKLAKIDPDYEDKDADYIFLTFILDFLPHGLIGLLLAVIFSAAMSSTAGELNALASTTTIDYYKKFWSKSDDAKKDLRVSKWLTVMWGVLAIIIALTAGLFENLIQLVNILGSLFYGTILGVFLLAFFFKRVKAKAALIAAIIAQLVVFGIHYLNTEEIIELSYLMYNIIGSMIVLVLGLLFLSLIHI